jgi:aminoglycoside phosphotransferase (APT) family kinase protein
VANPQLTGLATFMKGVHRKMSQPWSPEIVVTLEDAKRLIEEQFPSLKPIQISEIGKGFDNTVYNVNEHYVFRFPRRDIAVTLLNIENKLLPLLVNVLSIPIPEPLFFGKPSEHYKWIFTGYRHVLGKTPGIMTDEIRNLSAEPLAHFFKMLHQFPVKKAKEFGVPYDKLERTNIAKRKSRLMDNLEKAINLQLVEEDHLVVNWLKTLKDVTLDSTLTLVHGDCHILNILVDVTGVISGVIDWGDIHLGHPAIDLSIAYSFLPPSGRNKFFQIYGEVPKETLVSAQFFAVYVSIFLLLYGHDLKDVRLVKCAKESLRISLS